MNAITVIALGSLIWFGEAPDKVVLTALANEVFSSAGTTNNTNGS